MAKDLFIIKHPKPVKNDFTETFILFLSLYQPSYLQLTSLPHIQRHTFTVEFVTTSFLLHIIHYWTMIKHFTQNQVILYYTPPCSWEAGRLD